MGMVRKKIFSLFLLPLCFFGAPSYELTQGLKALQQIRSLIPERFSEQEFDIIVDKQGCEKAIHRYLLRWTLEGEAVRMTDSYLEFEYGPFWKYPTALNALEEIELSAGVSSPLPIESLEGQKLGTIVTKGNQYYSPDEIKYWLRSKSGDSLNMTQLTQDLARMNQNPFRRTDLILKPAKKDGIIDLELATVDRWPYRVYAGGDNTGTAITDRDRLFFGFNFGKTIVRDSEVAYQFTCAPNWNLFYAHTLFCRIPCPKRQTLIFFGGYSQVEPKDSPYKQRDVSWQLDGRYRFPLTSNDRFLQEMIVGYDFKQISSHKRSHPSIDDPADADINQFMVGYNVGQEEKQHRVSFLAEIYGNPGWITTRNKTEDYQKFRYGAKSTYAYLKISHAFACQFHRALWFTYDVNGQAATGNLLPSEQLTLTGYQAVRGFEERTVLVDNGVIVNASFETSRWSLGKSLGITKQALDELYFLFFFDYGLGGNHKTAPKESSFVNLASFGPGVRYQIDRWFSAHLEYGFQLWHTGFENPTDSRYNFGLMMSY